MRQSFDVVVVGGGIAGLLAARRAVEEGASVLLLERASAVGGLLRSTRSEQGRWFDFGTHIPARTGRAAIDRVLFDELEGIEWRVFDKLHKGNFFAGELNTRTQFIDITRLPAEDYRDAFVGTIGRVAVAPEGASLEDVLLARHGEHLVRTVFSPLLERIYRQPLALLSDRAHRFLAYSRIVVGDSDVSRELKRSPVYDAKVAFAHASEGGEAATYMYPVEGGCGAWVDALQRAAERGGAQVRTGTAVDSIDPAARRIAVGGASIAYGHLLWTAPVGLLARMLEPATTWARPAFVPTRLYHFDLSESPLCPSHYLYMNAPHMASFRVTLYGNVTGLSGDHRITVEAVDHEGRQDVERILGELVEAGVVPPHAQVRAVFSQALADGFPVLTLDAVSQNRRAAEAVRGYPGVVLAGRGGGDAFFMNDVLCEVDLCLDQIFRNTDVF